MASRTIKKKDDIEEKLEYLGLDLKKVPKEILNFEQLEYSIPKVYDEKQYRRYKYVPIKDIQILLSPTNRLDEMEEKYKKASPLLDYLDSESEENFIKHAVFLKMLKQVRIEEIEKIEEEQANLNKKIPFKVKYEGNYLWQIYYSKATDKYFMLVPTEDSDYSTFFYLLKKKLEKNKTGKIFVPIRNVEYSNTYLNKKEFEDIENYLWLFTKDWPLVYEVYDKNENLTIQIIGETQVYEKIKSLYKIKLTSKVEATKFYKLLKAMFILQTELPQYFKFRTDIGRTGEINFYNEDRKIQYEEISEWIDEEYELGEEKIQIAKELIKENEIKLEKLKEQVAKQEIEYLAKEKQISTFLECKKTFFGKFKYYFKYSKKNNKENRKVEKKLQEQPEKKNKTIKNLKMQIQKKHTIETLIILYKKFEELENRLKNLLMDINSLKLKNKNLEKKIQNATQFIEEIDNHKKSIFEFWKFSNKDEIAQLPEGEKEEVNIIKKITKVFDYEEDFEKIGKVMDEMQRKILTKEETDSIFITTTKVLEVLNKIKAKEITPKDIEISLNELKEEAIKEKTLTTGEEFDIFGGIAQDSTKVSKINNKKHRELPKEKFTILDINKNTKKITYKHILEEIIKKIKTATEKIVIPENISVYKAIQIKELNKAEINIFNINPEKEMEKAIKHGESKINFYKINLKEGTNAISYTNIIFYDNQNKTLPVGQDISTNILVDLTKLNLELKEKRNFKIISLENEKNDFSKAILKTVTLYEYDLK